MKVNDILELTIEGQGMDGEGVARVDGVVVFIPYTLVGEVVRCKIIQVRKSFAHAKVIKVISASADRVNPTCSAYFKCGGCDFLHINPSAHSRLKQAELLSNFKKIAGENVTVDEYVESDKMCAYRNKVQLPFGVVAGRVELGYYANKTHDIVPHERCMLHGEWADKLSKIVLNFVRSHQISIYDERSGKGLMRHLVMRKVAEVVAIVLVVNGDKVPFIHDLINDLISSNIKFHLHININREDTNVIMSDKLITIYGKTTIETEILGIKVEVSPLSFMQINDYIRDKIYLKAMELMQGVAVAIDLYSGIGITSNMLARFCSNVYSIEIIPEAVLNAKALAIANGNDNIITNICGDVAEELPKILSLLCRGALDKETIKAGNSIDECLSEHKNEDTALIDNQSSPVFSSSLGVLIDPPRKGCDKSTLDAVMQAAPDKIVYISCNHATLARDFAYLKSHYVITHLSAYDMFPNTHHVETLVCLTKKN